MWFAVIVLLCLSCFSFIFGVQGVSYTWVKSCALLKAFLDRAYHFFQRAGIWFFIELWWWSNQVWAFSIKVSWLQSWRKLRFLAIWSVKSSIARVDSWRRLIRIIERSFGTLTIESTICFHILSTLPILKDNLFLLACTHLLRVRCERQWLKTLRVMFRCEIPFRNVCNFIESLLLYLLLINNSIWYHALRAGKFSCSLLALFLI